jgi:hypothetical protein
VLRGETRGYRHHPQLARFFVRRDPLGALDCYLSRVLDEARARGYRLDGSKISYRHCRHTRALVTADQLAYEWRHLLGKLAVRDRSRWSSERLCRPEPHACFRVVPGPVAEWERTR